MSQAMTDDDFNLSLFIKLMKMTTATVDTEAILAMRKANAMLRANGHDWEQLLKGKITIVNDPFGSIPTPPPPTAAPAPKPPPPPPPPPQRSRRDQYEVDGWIALLNKNAPHLRSWSKSQLDKIVIDWQHHAPMMTDSDHSWLQAEARSFIPQARDPALVQQYFDTCDFAPLNSHDAQRVRTIQAEWKRRGDNKMSGADFNFITALHNQHHRPTKGRGKAKRLF
jgi:hypothetical protein